jgi:TetR/AcrR family transcriptional regulator
MPKIDHDTKQKILAAAEKVFHRNGFKGTRTMQIAEEAGISRTMLHYYFNTKEALFGEVLTNTLSSVFGHVQRLMEQQQDLEKVVENIVLVISDVLEEKPGLASFLVNIMNESPQMFMMLPTFEQDNLPALLNELLEAGKKKGQVSKHISGEDLILNIYALCSMPYLGAPYIKAKENRNDEDMKIFIRQRRASILDFVLKGMKP